MKMHMIFTACLFVASPASAQLYPMPGTQPPLMQPFQNDQFGPGLNRDATGRPFYWTPQGSSNLSHPDPTIQPNINAYGLGQSSDQYGRPIQPNMGLGLPDHSLSLPSFGHDSGIKLGD